MSEARSEAAKGTRTRIVAIRVNAQERQRLDELAARSGVNVSTLIRDRLFGQRESAREAS